MIIKKHTRIFGYVINFNKVNELIIYNEPRKI